MKRLAVVIGMMTALGSVAAGPAFVTMPPAITPARPIQAPGPVRAQADLNQAAMNQIITQLNQRQVQLSVAAAQSAVQRPIFVPRIISVKPAK